MLLPNYEDFSINFKKRKNQVVYQRLSADLDTAVSLMIKLTKDKKKLLSSGVCNRGRNKRKVFSNWNGS
jgi:hypothetical protein